MPATCDARSQELCGGHCRPNAPRPRAREQRESEKASHPRPYAGAMWPSGRSGWLLERVAVVAAVGWLAASAFVAVTWHRAGWPAPAGLASTASGVAHGRVWTLFSSALPVSRYPVAELAGCALTVAVALRTLGGVRFWAVALSSHVGSALIAYAGIAVLWLVAPASASEAAEELDYGISAVWFGTIGALLAVLHARGRGRDALVLAGLVVAVAVALAAYSGWLPVVEHLLALAIGATVTRALATNEPQAEGGRARRISGRWPSTRRAASPVRARPSDPS